MSDVVYENKQRNFDCGELHLVIRTFNAYKTITILELFSQLLEKTEIGNVLTGANNQELIALLAIKLPVIFKEGKKTLQRLLGAIVMGNKELLDLEDSDQDFYLEMEKKGREIFYQDDFSTEMALDLLTLGIEQMRLDVLRKKVPEIIKLVSQT